MSEHIKTDIKDRIQTVRISKPDKKNALTLDMYSGLAASLREADERDDVSVTILTGSGDSYCSGNDIQDFLQNPIEDESSPVLRFIRTIIEVEKPLIAAVNGVAVGVGTTMLLHCDLVYASASANFQFPFVNIGLCPEAGSSAILSALLGHHKASELLLLGERFDAEAAKSLGIVNDVVADAELESLVLNRAEQIAAQPPHASRITKGLLKAAIRDRIDTAVKRENEHFLPMLTGPEAREALSAFMEKRKPDFSNLEG